MCPREIKSGTKDKKIQKGRHNFCVYSGNVPLWMKIPEPMAARKDSHLLRVNWALHTNTCTALRVNVNDHHYLL